MARMRVLVTGGTGFVGRWAVASLRQAGHEVLVLSRKHDGHAQTVQGNLLKQGCAEAVVAKLRPEVILHLGWCVEHGTFWHSEENLDWVAATLRLAKAAAKHRVRRFVGVGTCFEYEWPEQSDCKELSTPLKPTSLYAVSKDATRRILTDFLHLAKIEFAWARLFYLFGLFEGPDRLVASIARKLAAGQAAEMSSGFVVRDFIDARDAGAALAALATASLTGPINIGSGESYSIADIARLLARAAGSEAKLHIGALPDRPDEPPRIVAEISRLKFELGFAPQKSTRTRLSETYEWWKNRGT